jgi:hypothetical protein
MSADRKRQRRHLGRSMAHHGSGQDVGLRSALPLQAATPDHRRRNRPDLEPIGCANQMSTGRKGQRRSVGWPVAHHRSGQDVGLRDSRTPPKGLNASTPRNGGNSRRTANRAPSRRHRLSVRTSPFQGGKTGSIPVGATTKGLYAWAFFALSRCGWHRCGTEES